MELSRQDRAAARHNPAPIKIGESNGITVSVLGPGETLPAILTPHEAVKPIVWADENKDFLIQTLRRHGAILFRGLDVTSVSEFEAFASKLCPTLFGEYNDLPHEAGKVYGTTPYPQDKTILFHNESSHMYRWPMKQFFYCIQPSLTGGRTPILDCREALRALDPAIVSDFETKGLLYIRNFAEGIDVPWQEFFHTKDKAEVEKFCKGAGMIAPDMATMLVFLFTDAKLPARVLQKLLSASAAKSSSSVSPRPSMMPLLVETFGCCALNCLNRVSDHW